MVELKPYFEFVCPAISLQVECTAGDGSTYEELQSKHVYNPHVQAVGLSII